ncbi:DUF1858 domain-containing protein [Clostridiisalibacter paucivorans]|uniref:DUF1858 domain-containing protein n=1 Tax=Clostridiisalibacter paucivorans TaxID=408753 RepID=UPI00047A7593|nr:DUF1858 domain-containing protein [Clostridiisalibacter paucivorans]
MFNKDMTIAEIIFKDRRTIKVFEKYGMGCKGCNGSNTETLESALRFHGIDVDEMLRELNKIVE